MPIPFICVATDVVSGKAKVWHDGPLTTAMRSTMSIPGMFKPVRIGNQILLDGGMRNNFPADLARDIGADIIIGIELSDAVKGYEEIYNLGDILYKGIDMLSNDAYERTLSIPTVTIKPDLHEFDMLSFDAASIETIIARGYEAAEAKADSLQMIRERLGNAHARKPARKAVDLSQESIRIDTILVSGVSRADANYIRHRIAYLTESPVSKLQIGDMQSLVQFQTADINRDDFRNVRRQGFDFHFMENLLEFAALTQTGRIAFQNDRNNALDHFIGLDDMEVNMQDLVADRVDLDFLHDGALRTEAFNVQGNQTVMVMGQFGVRF